MRDSNALSILFVLGLLGLAACGGQNVEYTLLFPETKALEKGTTVHLEGEEVGEVLSSDPRPERVDGERRTVMEVRVRIDRRYADLITEDSTIEVRRMPPVVGSRRVVIEPGQGETAEPGSTLRGEGPAWTWTRVQKWGDELKQMAGSEELRQSFRAFVDEAKEVARKGGEEWEKRSPELRARADELVEQAQEYGPKVSEWLSEQLDTLLRALEQDADAESGGESAQGERA